MHVNRSAFLYVVGDVFRDVSEVVFILDRSDARSCCPDTTLRDHTRATHLSRASPLRLTNQPLRVPVLTAMPHEVAEPQHAVPVFRAYAETPHLDFALQQRLHELATRDRALFRCQHHAIALHESLRLLILQRELTFRWTLLVVPVDVLMVAP